MQELTPIDEWVEACRRGEITDLRTLIAAVQGDALAVGRAPPHDPQDAIGRLGDAVADLYRVIPGLPPALTVCQPDSELD